MRNDTLMPPAKLLSVLRGRLGARATHWQWLWQAVKFHSVCVLHYNVSIAIETAATSSFPLISPLTGTHWALNDSMLWYYIYNIMHGTRLASFRIIHGTACYYCWLLSLRAVIRRGCILLLASWNLKVSGPGAVGPPVLSKTQVKSIFTMMMMMMMKMMMMHAMC